MTKFKITLLTVLTFLPLAIAGCKRSTQSAAMTTYSDREQSIQLHREAIVESLDDMFKQASLLLSNKQKINWKAPLRSSAPAEAAVEASYLLLNPLLGIIQILSGDNEHWALYDAFLEVKNDAEDVNSEAFTLAVLEAIKDLPELNIRQLESLPMDKDANRYIPKKDAQLVAKFYLGENVEREILLNPNLYSSILDAQSAQYKLVHPENSKVLKEFFTLLGDSRANEF